MGLQPDDKKYLAALHWACSANKKFTKLRSAFLNAREAWEASPARFNSAITGWNSNEQEAFLSKRKALDVDQYWERLQQLGIYILCPEEAAYPINLSYIFDPPPILYLKGSTARLKKEAVAIVGARKASSYGQIIADKLARDLAERGITIVSGLARGIDATAHRGALATGYTAAVLGCGLDVVYPRENRKLMEAIAEQGVLLSEYPVGTPASPWNFPIRNRLISGLSLGVVVIEAQEKSGSLITVDSALEQGRDVFAVPGNIFTSTSKGPHKLIKQGAKLVTCAEDVLEELGLDTLFAGLIKTNLNPLKLNANERKILKELEIEPLTVDSLAEKTELIPAELLAILTFLELRGLVKQLPGQYFMQIEK